MSPRNSLQRARRLGSFTRHGWDPETHHAMARLLQIIQQTKHNKSSATTVMLPGCHQLVQISISLLGCDTVMLHVASMSFKMLKNTNPAIQHHIPQDPNSHKNHYRNLKSHIAQINATDTIWDMPKIYRLLSSSFVGKHCKSYINSVNVLEYP